MSPQNPNLHPAEAAQKQRTRILKIVRATFLALIVIFTMLTVVRTNPNEAMGQAVISHWYIVVLGSIVLFGLALGIDLLTPNKKISTLSAVLVGVLAGMLATVAIGFVIDLMVQGWGEEPKVVNALQPIVTAVKILVGLTCCYLGVSTVLQTQDDFRLVVPYVEFAKQLRGTRAMLLDTSALIDGRISDVAATGFLQAPIVVPQFVVAELQTLSDSGDPMKRAKGRRGLEIVSKLQRLPKVDMSIDEKPVPGKAVDQMLVELAREMPALIVTADVALARVAAIQSVQVLNLNDLANAVKMALVPGEPVTVKLMRPGEQAGQAVGYLADGTMIVAEDGAGQIGQTVTMVVTSSLQTSAGRLIFARIGGDSTTSLQQAVDALPATAQATPADPVTTEVASNGGNGGAANGGGESSPRSPYPPKPRPVRAGTPRNPRR